MVAVQSHFVGNEHDANDCKSAFCPWAQITLPLKLKSMDILEIWNSFDITK